MGSNPLNGGGIEIRSIRAWDSMMFHAFVRSTAVPSHPGLRSSGTEAIVVTIAVCTFPRRRGEGQIPDNNEVSSFSTLPIWTRILLGDGSIDSNANLVQPGLRFVKRGRRPTRSA